MRHSHENHETTPVIRLQSSLTTCNMQLAHNDPASDLPGLCMKEKTNSAVCPALTCYCGAYLECCLLYEVKWPPQALWLALVFRAGIPCRLAHRYHTYFQLGLPPARYAKPVAALQKH